LLKRIYFWIAGNKNTRTAGTMPLWQRAKFTSTPTLASSKPPSPFLVERLAPFPEPLFPRWRYRTGLDRSEEIMLGTILIIILILLLIDALPTWPYSNGWGYYPGGGLGLILIIVIVLVLVGRI
jgi:Protein of unknown function (DUF3309)